MHSFQNHFIDTNVIIGYIIGWDGLKIDSGNYFNFNFNRYASKNVMKECTDVLSNNKSWIMALLNNISKASKTTHIKYLNHDLTNLIETTSSNLAHSKKSYETIEGILSHFARVHKTELGNILLGNVDYRSFRKNVTTAFKESRQNLIKLFKYTVNEKDGHPAPIPNFFSQYQRLSALGVHKTDFILLADAFHIKHQYVKDEIAFITFDKGIIDTQTEIEEEFYIPVIKPT